MQQNTAEVQILDDGLMPPQTAAARGNRRPRNLAGIAGVNRYRVGPQMV